MYNRLVATLIGRAETVLIPAGAFTMGDDNGRPDERPAHRVTLSAFHMAVVPVANGEYADFLAATGHEPPRFWDDPAFNHPRQPVVGVSWFDAVAYCDWLSGVLGLRFRLPTEAEWEKAARGGAEGAKYPWGDAPFDGSDGRFRQDATWQVGAAPPNGYGLIDIGFNVHEWCSRRQRRICPSASRREGGPGATPSKSAAAPPAAAFRRTTATTTTVSASP